MALIGQPVTRSLNVRLLAFAGCAIALALALAWLVLGALFERHAERQLQAELERHGVTLIAALRLDQQGLPRLDRQPSDPRFDRPASGLYWRLATSTGELRSRSLWDGQIESAASVPATGWTIGSVEGPFEPQVMIAMRAVQPDPGGGIVHVMVAANRAPLIEARSAFEQESALFLLVLWLVLALAAWVQVRLGLRPLAMVRDELEAMSQASDARLDASAHPAEIRPLTEAINRVAQQRAEDIVKARQRARDLAHALKTPLTALRLEIDRLAPEEAQRLSHSLSLFSRAVEGELARVGAKGPAGEVLACGIVERLVAVVSRTPDGQRIALANCVPPGLRIPMSEDAALEAVGALIENAVRHARTRVVISGGQELGERWLLVEDDGPGIPPDLRKAALSRGGRLDERGGGHGLGLAIAQDFVLGNCGELLLDEAEMGGLSVRMAWAAAD